MGAEAVLLRAAMRARVDDGIGARCFGASAMAGAAAKAARSAAARTTANRDRKTIFPTGQDALIGADFLRKRRVAPDWGSFAICAEPPEAIRAHDAAGMVNSASSAPLRIRPAAR